MIVSVARYYDKIADKYLDKYLRIEYYRVLYRKIGEVIDRYIREGMSVLDIGSGIGFWTAYMWRRGAAVYALDISHQSLKVCRCPDKITADAALLPSRDGAFDAVTALGSVYNHLEKLDEAILAASRVLKNGGVFIADIDNAVCLDMLWEYILFQGIGKLKEALLRGFVRGSWESADGEIPFDYYGFFKVRGALRRANLKLIEARPIYLASPLPSRLQQRRMRAKFFEKLDLLKPLAPLATTVIYVAVKP